MSTIFNTFSPKHAGDVLDYSFDWSRWLGSDTITTATFSLTPLAAPAVGDATFTPANPPFTGAIATMWVSGGVVGASYYLSSMITTAGGRTVEVTSILAIIPDND
jgi:hypothetical protein